MIPRLALAVAGLTALGVAFPGVTPVGVGLALGGLAALGRAVVRPGSAAAAALIGVGALEWAAAGPGSGLARVVLLALAVAVVHHAAALAAVTPRSAPVASAVLRRWALRCLVTTAAGVLVVVATEALPRTPAPVWTAAAAVLVVTGAALAGWRLARGRAG